MATALINSIRVKPRMDLLCLTKGVGAESMIRVVLSEFCLRSKGSRP